MSATTGGFFGGAFGALIGGVAGLMSGSITIALADMEDDDAKFAVAGIFTAAGAVVGAGVAGALLGSRINQLSAQLNPSGQPSSGGT